MPAGIDKSVLAFPEPRRIRDKEHLKFVSRQPCLVCGRRPSDAHHLRFAQLRALGRKVSDEFTVPLCRTHHREIHHCGDETAWWSRQHLDPLRTAAAFWRRTHPLPVRTEQPAVENGPLSDVQDSKGDKDPDGQAALPAIPHDETKPIVAAKSP